MKCSNCKKIIPDNVRFCPECGSLITTHNNAQIIHMRCKQCGGTMEVEEGQSVFKCQYCGSTQIIIDSDEVAKEKIKQSTKKEIVLNDPSKYTMIMVNIISNLAITYYNEVIFRSVLTFLDEDTRELLIKESIFLSFSSK